MTQAQITEWAIPELEKAWEELEKISQDPKLQLLYDTRMRQVLDEQARYDTAIIKGLEEGLKQGIEQGIEKGIEQGIEKGREILVLSLQGLAKQRFPRMKESTLERVDRLSLEALEDILTHFYSSKNASAFRKMLSKWESVEGE